MIRYLDKHNLRGRFSTRESRQYEEKNAQSPHLLTRTDGDSGIGHHPRLPQSCPSLLHNLIWLPSSLASFLHFLLSTSPWLAHPCVPPISPLLPPLVSASWCPYCPLHHSRSAFHRGLWKGRQSQARATQRQTTGQPGIPLRQRKFSARSSLQSRETCLPFLTMMTWEVEVRNFPS